MVLVFRTPDSACPSSHLVLLSSCSSHHLPTPHTSCNIPGSSGFLAKCSRSWTEPPTCQLPHMASTSDSLAMRSLSELPSGILGDGAPGLGGLCLPFQVLGAQITAPAPAFPYLLTPPCKAHLPFKESKINVGAQPHPTPSFINPSQSKCHRNQQPDCCT